MKKYYLHIISFIIFLFLMILSINSSIKEHNKILNNINEYYNNNCIIDIKNQDACNTMKETLENKYSAFVLYSQTLTVDYFPNSFTLILFTIIPSCYFITKYLKNKLLLNENNRNNYNKNIIKVFKVSYLSSLIIPITLLFTIIFYIIYTKRISLLPYELSLIPWEHTNNIFMFILMYITNNLLTTLIYVNISLIISRKQHNYFISLILTFLSILGIELFLEVILDGIISGIISKSGFGIIFNIINSIPFNDSYGIYYPTLFTFIVLIITQVILYYSYKNKEKLIIDIEKN